LNDLLERDDWQSLFAGLPNGAGFVARLGDFFARHRGGLLVDDNIRRLYFQPLKRNALDAERLVLLAKQHVAELRRLAGLAGDQERVERLAGITPVWTDDGDAALRTPMPADNLGTEVYETIGDFFNRKQDAQPPWFYCLREACYGMAADYDLQRYLMTDFYQFRFDFRAYYEFWVGGGYCAIADGRWLVTSAECV
jgi:hypothetical protein